MYSLLYVDDEPGLLEITKLFLERRGNFSVDTSLSATDALQLPGIASYDAIVSDYQMPGMDGIAFLKAVREKFGDIPFILFTGRGREEVVIEAINNGADFYLQKGGDPSAQFAELAHKARQAIARRNAERSLVESEKRLADIINFLPDATFAIDRSGRVIAWNRAIEGMTGVPAARMMEKGDYEYAVPFYGKRRPILIDLIFEPDEKIAGFYSGIIREGPTLTAETDLPHPKGIRINVLAKASPLYNREGAVVGAIESIRDITGLKHAEEDLSRARKDWETIFRGIGHPAFVLDAENRIIDANDATLAATKKSLSELVGLHCYEVFHTPGTTQPPPGCPFEQANAPGTMETRETEIAALGGYYAVTCTPVYGADGKLEKVIHIAMDVTERRKATDELRAAYEQLTASEEELRANYEELAANEKKLRENETRFRAVFEKSHDALVLFTKDGCIDCNRHAVELFGYSSREALLGLTPLDTSAPVQPDGRPSAAAAADHIRTAMEKGADRFEWLQQRKDGTMFLADVLLSEYVLDGKEIYLSSIRDITERKRMEDELRLLKISVDRAYDEVFWMDFSGNILYVNDAACRVTGYSAEELLAMKIFELDPDFSTEIWEKSVTDLREKKAQFFTARHRCRNGSVIDVEISAAYVKGNGTEYSFAFVRDITARKRIEDALQKRLVALTRPLDDTGIAFEDLFDLDEIQRLQDEFAKATGVAVLLTRPDGTPITKPSNFCRLCAEIVRRTPEGRAKCIRSDAELGKLHEGGPVIHTCLSAGLWGAGTSIVLGGRHIANWLIGQVRNEAQSEASMRAYARDLGVDEEDFIKAFLEVPVMSCERFESIAQSLSTLANQLSKSAYQNVQQARFIAEQKKAEDEIRALSTELQQIFRNMTNAFVVFESVFNEQGEYVSFRFGRFNDAYARIANVTWEEVKGKDIFEVWPGTEQSWVETYGKVATTGISSTFEMYHGPTTGWYRCNAYRPTDSPDKICVIFEDITERKKTEEALLQANIVVENSPAVLFRWKAEEGWPVVYVSQNVSRFG
ncbi:MAG TPA: PAS domain S-box protein, partial [Methanoregulaceae archaeon]|nr:PAS domain S-box protein [Methanoregulaceae archaeon]